MSAFDVGAAATGIAVGDFNNDTRLDIVTSNDTANTVSVLLAKATGGYNSALTYSTGTTPIAIDVGDFNTDGSLDLVTANQSAGTASVLLGAGNGMFTGATNFTVGSRPTGVAAKDVNGDGKVDIVTSNTSSGNVSVLQGLGTGSFATQTGYTVGHAASSISVGDLNADGKPDFAVTSVDDSSVGVLINVANVSFTTAATYPAGGNPVATALGDFTSDGLTDIVVADGSGLLKVLAGQGNGLFPTAPRYAIGTNPVAVAVADLNADGMQDMVVAHAGTSSSSSPANVSVLLGVAGNNFAPATSYSVSVGSILKLTDLNADTYPDILIPRYGGASVLLSNGKGGISSATSYSHSGSYCDAGDVNGDQRLDLVCADSSWYYLAVALGNANGTFGTFTTSYISNYTDDIAVADINGDGSAEFAIADSTAAVFIYPAQSSGTYDNPTQPTTYVLDAAATGVDFADINGDGAPDLAAISGSKLFVLLNDGSGALGTPVATTGVGTAYAFGDLNADGKLDLVTSYGTGEVYVSYGDGSGAFTPASYYSSFGWSRAFALVDIFKDGPVDIVSANWNGYSSTNGNVSLLLHSPCK
jgi:hypothetical protein